MFVEAVLIPPVGFAAKSFKMVPVGSIAKGFSRNPYHHAGR